MGIWNRISLLLPPDKDEIEEARGMYREFMSKKYVDITPSAAVRIKDAVIAYFYKLLEDDLSGEAASIVAGNKDSSWMKESDFCFMNIRATGTDEFGNFIQAAKMLPSIRCQSIHLGPFTSYDFNVIYAVTSVKIISGDIIHKTLEKLGIDDETQLCAFCDAVHLLGKTVGFDLEPHVAQFAVTVLIYPDIFRWIKLTPDKKTDPLLYVVKDGKKYLNEDFQRVIHKEIADIVNANIGNPDDKEKSIVRDKNLYHKIVKEIISAGYWTISAHAWDGIGIPDYNGYNFAGNYAEFYYLNEMGEERGDYAYKVLTPFKFYNELPVNAKPDNACSLNEIAVDYFKNIFIYFRDNFSFDFIRYDSLDHVYDSCDQAGNPFSDRPTPEVLESVIKHSQKNKPYIGHIAERMGDDVEPYADSGFDLILGNDMLFGIDRAHVERIFKLGERIAVRGISGRNGTAAFAIDTHDTGNPYIWGESLIRKMGFDKMRLRHFVSRFASVGSAMRPKYEVAGFQDLSHGLFQANVTLSNIVWEDNKNFYGKYNIIENLYDKLKDNLRSSKLILWRICDGYAYWIISSPAGLLVMVVSYESERMENCYNITIDIEGIGDPFWDKITIFDMQNGGEALYPFKSGKIFIHTLEPCGFRIYKISR